MDGCISQISLWAGLWAPQGWMFCQGQILEIASHTELFSVIGSTYGGNGFRTFALPDLRGRVPIGAGPGGELRDYPLGARLGAETITLLADQMPLHTHKIAAGTGAGGTVEGAIDYRTQLYATNAVTRTAIYGANLLPTATLDPASVQDAGGNQPHSNLQPVLSLNYIICVHGTYPTRPAD